jgi:DNA-binding FadR family transcriptional regulator
MLGLVPPKERTSELPSERTERLVRAYVAQAAPGSRLPAVKAWAIELGTSRTTLSRVIGKLSAEGIVIVRVGWGVFKAE